MFNTIFKSMAFLTVICSNDRANLFMGENAKELDIKKIAERIGNAIPDITNSVNNILKSELDTVNTNIMSTPQIKLLMQNDNQVFDYVFLDNFGNIIFKLITTSTIESRFSGDSSKISSIKESINPLFRLPQYSIYIALTPSLTSNDFSGGGAGSTTPRNAIEPVITSYSMYTNFDDVLGTIQNNVVKSSTLSGYKSVLSKYSNALAQIKYYPLLTLREEITSPIANGSLSYGASLVGPNLKAYETDITTNYTGITFSTWSYLGKAIDDGSLAAVS